MNLPRCEFKFGERGGSRTASTPACSRAVDLDALVEFMMQTATVAKPDVLGVIEGFFNAVEYMLLDGKFVRTPIAVIIAGSGPTDRNGNARMGLRTNTYAQLAWGLA